MKNLVVKIIGVLILLISNVVAQTTVMSENFDNLPVMKKLKKPIIKMF